MMRGEANAMMTMMMMMMMMIMKPTKSIPKAVASNLGLNKTSHIRINIVWSI